MTKTIGELIKNERGKQGISLENIASVTKISVDTLKKIEENDFKNLPARPYIRGFLTSIAKVLGINKDDFLKMYIEQEEGKKTSELAIETSEETIPKQQEAARKKHDEIQDELKADLLKQKEAPSIVLDEEVELPVKEKIIIPKMPVKIPFQIHKKHILIAGISALLILLLIIFFADRKERPKIEKPLGVNLEQQGSEPAKLVEPAKEEQQLIEKKNNNETEKNKNTAIEKALPEANKKNAEKKNTSYSLLKVFARGKSWVKLKIDEKGVLAYTFVVGMTKVFRVYSEASIYVSDASKIDIYFRGEKISFDTEKTDQVIKVKHEPLQEIKVKQNIEKNKMEVDKKLIAPPVLTPEQLTR